MRYLLIEKELKKQNKNDDRTTVTTNRSWLMHAYIHHLRQHHRVLVLFWYMSIEKQEKERLITMPIKDMILFLPDPEHE